MTSRVSRGFICRLYLGFESRLSYNELYSIMGGSYCKRDLHQILRDVNILEKVNSECLSPGLIHPGLIGTAPSQQLLDIWNERERKLVSDGPEALTLGGCLHTRPMGKALLPAQDKSYSCPTKLSQKTPTDANI